jgi:RNA polymerase primary sigma factor
MSQLSEMGVNVVENDDSDDDDAEPEKDADPDDEVDPLDDSGPRPALLRPKKEAATVPRFRCRMYLARNVGAVELSAGSREGRIAIAKRIEGRPRHHDLGPVRKPDPTSTPHHRMVQHLNEGRCNCELLDLEAMLSRALPPTRMTLANRGDGTMTRSARRNAARPSRKTTSR